MIESVYIHIPFCHKICSYCDFAKLYYKKEWVDNYLDALEKEINQKYKNEKIKTIYIGGGTPSSLNLDQLKKLFNIINKFNLDQNLEFTFECNIENINEKKLIFLKKNKVNRLSIGIESFNNKILKILNRKNIDFENTKKLIDQAKKIGFENINIDLIYAAYDNVDILKNDLECFLELGISHISTYSLMIEDNTILKINGMKNISEDIDYDMYKYIEDALEKNNYIHYEISNYAKNGYQSKHNLVYWNNEEYYGFGLSSTSYINNYRMNNVKNLSKYLDGIYLKDKDYEEEDIRIENEIMLGLRKIEGINLKIFREKYNKDLEDIYNIDYLLGDSYLIKKNNYLSINKKYMYISNEIIVRIIDSKK